MKRILVFGMTENPGGVESFLINYYRHINKNIIQWDFLCNTLNPVAYEDELVRLGGRCFHISARSVNRQKFKRELEVLFAEHYKEWSAVWINVCSLANIDYLKIAKKYNIKKRIIHSHNSQNMDGLIRGVLHRLNKLRIKNFATDFWACSYDAAKWFYRGGISNKVVIIHNAIDTESMCFNEEKRNFIRKKYGWENKYIIGNVGRLHYQKNQSFSIDIFFLYHKINPDSILIFVGQGDDYESLKEKVKKLQLNKFVYFVGVQNDIQAWLSSFDFFLFPSKFEGLGIACLEAQANGIPALASKKVIPEEVKMNDNLIFMDLESGAEAWSNQIENMKWVGRSNLFEIKDNFIKKGYDIVEESVKLEGLLTDLNLKIE